MQIGDHTVTAKGEIEEPGEVYPPGSPEDLAQILYNLNEFFTNKVKAIELYKQGIHQDIRSTTAGTRSVCHIDGTDDGDGSGGKLPDV